MNANSSVPKIFKSNKKTIGIRVPDHPVTLALVHELGNPLISTSVHDDDEIIEYITDPELINEKYADLVDIVVDGGIGHVFASTVLDCTTGDVEVVREGLGPIEGLL